MKNKIAILEKMVSDLIDSLAHAFDEIEILEHQIEELEDELSQYQFEGGTNDDV